MPANSTTDYDNCVQFVLSFQYFFGVCYFLLRSKNCVTVNGENVFGEKDFFTEIYCCNYYPDRNICYQIGEDQVIFPSFLTRGPFKNYVRMFLAFLVPPTHLRQYCKSAEIAIF